MKNYVKKIGIKHFVYVFTVLLMLLFLTTGCDPNADGSTTAGGIESTGSSTSDNDSPSGTTGQDPDFNLTAYDTSNLTAFREGPSCSVADIDGDDDVDVLITGEDPADNQRKSILYNNDGNGNFTPNSSALTGVEAGTSAFADVDNDGDMDLCIAGKAGSTTPETSFYINNGSGSFSVNTAANLTEVWLSAIAFGDVDNDGFKDLIMSGGTFRADDYNTLIYINNGVSSDVWQGFSLSSESSTLTQVQDGSLDLADVDGDGYLDLLLTGAHETDPYKTTTLYINQGDPASDGWDGFTDSGESFTGVNSSDAVFSDVDGDDDADIIIAGGAATNILRAALLYRNNGSGGYTLDTETSFEPLSIADIITGDIDDDGDIDLIITGYDSNANYYSGFYRNNGSGSFTEEDFGITNIGNGEGHFFDVDGDGDLDLINCGEDDEGTAYAELYINDLN